MDCFTKELSVLLFYCRSYSPAPTVEYKDQYAVLLNNLSEQKKTSQRAYD